MSVVRWLSRVTGTTSWYDDWDGALESLIEIAEWKAANDAEWLDDERRLHGETGWEREATREMGYGCGQICATRLSYTAQIHGPW